MINDLRSPVNDKNRKMKPHPDPAKHLDDAKHSYESPWKGEEILLLFKEGI